MNTTKPLKIAVMGFENGHCYFLYKALRREPMIEVVAVSFAPRARIIYEKRLGAGAFDGVDIFYDDETMLDAHPEIEAVVTGGANAEHRKEFRLCSERGLHMISMKAPTYDMDEYDEMIRLQKERRVLVYIELEMRWKATVERIRELIAGGALGKVESFCALNYSHNPMWWQHWMDIPEQSYGKRIPIRPGDRIFRGGALTDHPHIFDLVRYLFGCEFETVYASAAPNMRDGAETEDMVYIVGRLENGVIVSLDPSYANREPEQARIEGLNLSKYPRPVQVELQVNGSGGTLLSDAYGTDYVEDLAPGTMKYTVDGGENVGGNSLDDQRRIFLRNFVSDIRNGTDHTAVSLAEHKKTLTVVNACYESIYTGKPVHIRY